MGGVGMGEAEVVQPGPAPEQSARAARCVRNFYFLCLPTLLGTVAFVFSFPLTRPLPFFHSVYLYELYTVWWVLVAPVFTLIAYILLTRSTWKDRWLGKSLAMAWTTFILTSALNLLWALAMIAAGT